MDSTLLTEICNQDFKFRLKPTKTLDKSAPILHVDGEKLRIFATVCPTVPPPPPPLPPPMFNSNHFTTPNPKVECKMKKVSEDITKPLELSDRNALFEQIKAGNFTLKKSNKSKIDNQSIIDRYSTDGKQESSETKMNPVAPKLPKNSAPQKSIINLNDQSIIDRFSNSTDKKLPSEIKMDPVAQKKPKNIEPQKSIIHSNQSIIDRYSTNGKKESSETKTDPVAPKLLKNLEAKKSIIELPMLSYEAKKSDHANASFDTTMKKSQILESIKELEKTVNEFTTIIDSKKNNHLVVNQISKTPTVNKLEKSAESINNNSSKVIKQEKPIELNGIRSKIDSSKNEVVVKDFATAKQNNPPVKESKEQHSSARCKLEQFELKCKENSSAFLEQKQKVTSSSSYSKSSPRFEALRHNFECSTLQPDCKIDQNADLYTAKPIFVKLSEKIVEKTEKTILPSPDSGNSSPKRSLSPTTSLISSASSSASSSTPYSTWRVRKDQILGQTSQKPIGRALEQIYQHKSTKKDTVEMNNLSRSSKNKSDDVITCERNFEIEQALKVTVPALALAELKKYQFKIDMLGASSETTLFLEKRD